MGTPAALVGTACAAPESMLARHTSHVPRGSREVVCAILCTFVLAASPAAGQEAEPEDDPRLVARTVDEGAAENPVQGEQAEEEEVDPCASEYLEGRSWLDWLNLRLHRTACETALWFDHLFGDYRLDEELEATYGRALVGVIWDEQYGFEDDLRFRARLHFPNMERRLNAFIGRDDREDVLEDAQRRGVTSLPRMFDAADDEWLLGLGYRPISGGNGDLDFDVGMNFDFPIEPFARARYKHRTFLSDSDLVRFRHSLFWEREDGWGLSTRIDYEHAFAGGAMMRWRGAGKISDITHGADWFTELSYYHRVGRRRAIAHQIGANGETDMPVQIENYFVRLIYRQQILREWLFLEIGPGMAWRRDTPDVPRDSVPILRFGVEMLFGDYRGQGTAAPVPGR